MQVTVTMQPTPRKRYALHMRVQPGVRARSRKILALASTQEMPRIAAPDETTARAQFLAVCAAAAQQLQAEAVPQFIHAHADAPILVLRPVATATRKPALDWDAALMKELQDYRLVVASSADGERAFRRNELAGIAIHNKQAAKKRQALVERDADAEDESDGKIAGYTMVADAVQRLIDALSTDYDAFLDAVPVQVAWLEQSITNHGDTYHMMRDGIIAEGAQEIARKWMGEE